MADTPAWYPRYRELQNRLDAGDLRLTPAEMRELDGLAAQLREYSRPPAPSGPAPGPAAADLAKQIGALPGAKGFGLTPAALAALPPDVLADWAKQLGLAGGPPAPAPAPAAPPAAGPTGDSGTRPTPAAPPAPAPVPGGPAVACPRCRAAVVWPAGLAADRWLLCPNCSTLFARAPAAPAAGYGFAPDPAPAAPAAGYGFAPDPAPAAPAPTPAPPDAYGLKPTAATRVGAEPPIPLAPAAMPAPYAMAPAAAPPGGGPPAGAAGAAGAGAEFGMADAAALIGGPKAAMLKRALGLFGPGGAAAGGAAAGGEAAAAGGAELAGVAAEAAGGPIVMAATAAAKAVTAAATLAGDGFRAAGKAAASLAGNDGMALLSQASEGVAGALEKIPIVGEAFAETVRAATAAVTAFRTAADAFVARGRELQGYNGDLAAANATADTRKLLADIREAGTIGKSTAGLTDSMSRIDVAFQDALGPLKDQVAALLDQVAKPVAELAEAAGTVVELAEALGEPIRAAVGVVGDAEQAGLIDLIRASTFTSRLLIMWLKGQDKEDEPDVNAILGDILAQADFAGGPAAAAGRGGEADPGRLDLPLFATPRGQP